ncbi:MAG: CHASE2 domain-containing protein, partial [Candidatus Aureabacteria bacterium]|nr:CHASE2 domain-containing protein [Candidatus Auribacterota bacterium]
MKKSIDLNRLLHPRRIAPFLIHYAILLVISGFFYGNACDKKFNLWYSDLLTHETHERQQKPGRHDNRYVIVEVDDPSFNWLSQSYGSMRISIAHLLTEITKNNPQSVAVLFLFYGKGLPIENIYLTSAVNTGLPIFFLAGLGKDNEYFTPLDAYSAPYPRFGFLNFVPDEDKTVRRVRITAPTKELGLQFDLSTQMATDFFPDSETIIRYDSINRKLDFTDKNNQKIHHSLFPDKDGCIPLQLIWGKNDILSVSALDMIQGKVSPSIFNGKVVILDGTASVYQNKILTPIGINP